MNAKNGLLTIALGAILLLTGAANADARCVEFANNDHCPIGNAQLTLAADGTRLIASDLGREGDDGVVARFGGAREWRGDLRIADARFGQRAEFASISNGFMTSGLSLFQGRNGLVLRAQFTGGLDGGSYRLVLLNGGEVVADVGDMDNSRSTILNRFPPIDIPPPEDFPPIIIFGLNVQGLSLRAAGPEDPPGGCFWRLPLDRKVEIFVDGVSIGVGDEIRMEEDIDSAGHYAYASFDALRMTSSGSSIVITDEKTVPAAD